MSLNVCPECANGKHGNCEDVAWNFDDDGPCCCFCYHSGHDYAKAGS